MQTGPSEMTRERLYTMRISGDEAETFERVAKHHQTNVAGVIRLLMKREEQDIADADRKRWRESAPGWERDKIYVAWLAALANIFKLKVTADDATRTFTIESPWVPPKDEREGLTRDEAIHGLATWAKSDILEVDPHTRAVVVLPKGSNHTKTVEPPAEALEPTSARRKETKGRKADR